jgi:hypothetical protein
VSKAPARNLPEGAGSYQNTAYQFHPTKPKTTHPLDETTSRSTKLQKTATKSLVNPNLPLEGEGIQFLPLQGGG